MIVEQTKLQDVLIVIPNRFGDHRGFFSESWNKKRCVQAGIACDFVQDNHSLSSKAGTIRGLHFQAPPFAQDKLVRCGRGALLDVAVDARAGSSTFGQWISEVLSLENGKQLFVPKGFLHGFLTLEDDTEIVYKCSDYYDAESDGAVRFDDPDLAIDWGGYSGVTHVSDKDANAMAWADFETPFSASGTLT